MMDIIGNQIKVGDLVHYRGQFLPLAEVVEIHEGGVSMRDGSKSPQSLTLIFKVTVAAPPRVPFQEVLVVKKPAEEGETKIASA